MLRTCSDGPRVWESTQLDGETGGFEGELAPSHPWLHRERDELSTGARRSSVESSTASLETLDGQPVVYDRTPPGSTPDRPVSCRSRANTGDGPGPSGGGRRRLVGGECGEDDGTPTRVSPESPGAPVETRAFSGRAIGGERSESRRRDRPDERRTRILDEFVRRLYEVLPGDISDEQATVGEVICERQTYRCRTTRRQRSDVSSVCTGSGGGSSPPTSQ